MLRHKASKLGERVMLLRKHQRLTQPELAEAVSLSANTIARLERGYIQDLRGAHLWKLADFFGVTLDFLVGRKWTERDETKLGAARQGESRQSTERQGMARQDQTLPGDQE